MCNGVRRSPSKTRIPGVHALGATYARRRMRGRYIESRNGDRAQACSQGEEREEACERDREERERSRNDFPSFFLNLVRLIDALDRNGAINLVVSISIMAILNEENESGNARVAVEAKRGGGGNVSRDQTRELRFRTTAGIIWYRLRLACAACVDSERRLMSTKGRFSILERESTMIRSNCCFK